MACVGTMGDLCNRMIKPGNNNTQVTEAINKVAKVYDCHLVQGILMHQVRYSSQHTLGLSVDEAFRSRR